MNDLIPTTPQLPARITPESLVTMFLAGRKATTLRAYQQALDGFAAWSGKPASEAVRDLLAQGNGPANATAAAYRIFLTMSEFAPATIALRITALRSIVKLARIVGLVNWSLDVEIPRVRAYRDTSGPGAGNVARIAGEAGKATGAKGKRDAAIVRLLYANGLRRAEVASLDLEHVDLDRRRVSIVGKGRTDREWVTVPESTAAALRDWIAVRGSDPGPLFVELATGNRGRLTGTSINRNVVKSAGRKLGLDVSPHKLRHAGITAALDATGGDVRSVAKFSRHANMNTVIIYDDNRADAAGRVADLIALPTTEEQP